MDVGSALGLVTCDTCKHCILIHSGGGCNECACFSTRETIIEEALAAAREEIRLIWRVTNAGQANPV